MRDFPLIPRLQFVPLLMVELFVFVSNVLHGVGQLIAKELRWVQSAFHQQALFAFFGLLAMDLLEKISFFFESLLLSFQMDASRGFLIQVFADPVDVGAELSRLTTRSLLFIIQIV